MNTKKINELTMMETVSDAANVLVEENGEAKRVPAGKMVAGSLPEHLQFGEEIATVSGPVNITWDGNTDGSVKVFAGESGAFFYKVSDDVFSDEQLKLMSISLSTDLTFVLADVWNEALGTQIVVSDEVTIAVAVASVRKDGAAVKFGGDFPYFPEKGIYFIALPEIYYTASLASTEPVEQTKIVVKPIDKKYLPESVAQVTKFYVEYGRDCYIYTDETFNNRASKQDVLDAISKGVIYVHSNTGAMTLVSQILVLDYVQIKAALYAWENVDLNDFYTAEYVEEDAGPS